MTEKKSKKGGVVFLIVVIVVALAVLALGILRGFGVIKIPSISASAFSQRTRRDNPSSGLSFGKFNLGKFSGSTKYVANLYITGVIEEANESYNQEWLLDTIDELENDQNNVGIMLVIDSPGGSVYEADEVYLALRKYKNSGKQLWAYFKSIAASGGYYIACAADSIYANRNTMTGSIGVIIGPTFDATALLEKIGVKATSFVSGKNKGMLNFNEPLTDEQKDIVQALVDECYEQFTDIVASARNKSIKEVKALADGRLYTAKQAKENGLIDFIGTLENAEDRMKERLAIVMSLSSDEADQIEFYDYDYVYDPPLMRRFFDSIAGDSLRKALENSFGPAIRYPAYLYRQ